MIKIFRLTPIPIESGTWDNGILEINNKSIKISENDLIKRFNSGYWRCMR